MNPLQTFLKAKAYIEHNRNLISALRLCLDKQIGKDERRLIKRLIKGIKQYDDAFCKTTGLKKRLKENY